MKNAVFALLLLAGTAVMPAGAARAEGARGENPVPPSDLAERRYFLVTEAGVRKTWRPVTDHMDEYLFVNSIGLMKNFSHARAVGGSVDATLALGQLKFAPAVRYRQWLRRAGSVEVSLGYIAGDSRGMVGPVLNGRYSPTTSFYVEAGLCRIQDRYEGMIYYPYTPVPVRPHLNGYLGAGFGGVPARAVWGAEVVALGLLVAIFSGRD